MPVPVPATFAARRELSVLAADLDSRPGLTVDARFALRLHMSMLLGLIEAAEASPAHDGARQALAAVRGAAANGARALIIQAMTPPDGRIAA